MDFNLVLFGIIPLLAFVIVDSLAGLKSGLIAAIFFAIVELVYTIVKFGTVDHITGLSVGLVLLMSFFAWKKNSEKMFLYQPVVFSAFISIFMIVSYLVGEPLFVTMILKYGKDLIAPDMYEQFTQPMMLKLFEASTLTCGIGLAFHALATWYAVVKLNKWWWVAIRGIGFYVFMFTGMILARFVL